MTLTCRPIAVALAGLLLLAGCSGKDAPLPGTRLPLRPDEASVAPAAARALALPPAVVNADWTHRNGAAGGRIEHPALAQVPQLRWAAPLGEGDGRRRRLVVGPIVGGGLVYAMDAAGQLSAFDTGGRLAWRTSVVPAGQDPDSGPGGGMALSGNVLFVTTGFGEVLALAPGSGGVIWRRMMTAPVQGAPTVSGGQVFVVLNDDTALALDVRTGATAWQLRGTGGTGLLGGASPAASGDLVVFPFASGEVLGAMARNGMTVWGTVVSGGRRDVARNRINDISGDPVIAGNAVYASNQSGRTIRLDRTTGERLWTTTEGAYGPAWPVGDSLFLMSDIGTLVRIDAATGAILWSTQLPAYEPRFGLFGNPKPPIAAVAHYGPILAGGRLWVASGDGFLRAFAPQDGRLLAEVALPGGAAAAPAVAGGVLYVTTRDGRLLAFQ